MKKQTPEQIAVANKIGVAKAKKANTIIKQIGAQSEKLFAVILDAYNELHETRGWERFKLECHADNSTINKIVKIAQSDYVMKQLDVLPGSWSTLYVIARNAEKYAAEFDAAIERGNQGLLGDAITKKTTRAEVLALIPKDEGKLSAMKNLIRFDSSRTVLDEEAIDAIETLKSLGFEVKDLAEVAQ